MENFAKNKLDTIIKHSGNSDVDLGVNINIDTKSIAYGLLCSLFAKGEITELELEKAILKLDALIERDKVKKKSNDQNGTKQSKPLLFPFPKRKY
jgi:hypothetical protein